MAPRRWLRYIRHFNEAPGRRLPEEVAKELAVSEYDPRGTAGFYQGENAALAIDGKYRVLTQAGQQFFDGYRHLID